MINLIRKLDLKFSPEELAAGLKLVLPYFDQRNQVCINSEAEAKDPLYHNTGVLNVDVEPRCTYLNPQFRDSIFEKVLRSLDCPHSRARVMRLNPRSCYSMHWDTTPRFHLALETHHTSYLFFHDNVPVHIPADGHIYWVDTRKPHSAINCHSEPRYHLVVVDPFNEALAKKGYL